MAGDGDLAGDGHDRDVDLDLSINVDDDVDTEFEGVEPLDDDVDAVLEELPPGVDPGTPCDVVLLVPGFSDTEDWVGRRILYVPQRPRGTDAGARVYLCRSRALFYSYRIDGFLDLDESLPSGRTDVTEGWAIQVSDGGSIQRPLDEVEDPSGVATRWVQGFRYVSPGARSFIRSPRYRAEMPAKGTATEPDVESSKPVDGAEQRARRRWWQRRDHDTK